MSRKLLQIVPALALLAVGLVWVAPRAQGQAASMPSTKNGEWPTFTADLNGSKYSPLDQINASNFNKLEVAWRFKTDNLGPRPENKLEGTPIKVKGIVYATAGTRRSVVALDAKTGELKWTYGLDEGERARAVGAAPALGPRPLLLDRRPRRRAHPLHDDRLSARRAQREDRRSRSPRSARTASST